MLAQWILGKDKTKKIMTGSYNETLSTTFSKGVRNSIQEEKADDTKVVYSDIFSNTKIKQGDGAMNLWSLEGGYNNYLATSPSGTATGFGADIIIIDDLIKLSAEAYNSTVLDGHWEWFTNTMLSRLEEGGKIIIIMTRWATKDLAGRALDWCKAENKKHRHISLKAHLGNGKMLYPEVLSYKGYKSKISAMSEEIVRANYDQEPIDLKGRLYDSFKTYEDIPRDDRGNSLLETVKLYSDTADEGSDYLCNIIYGVYMQEAYVLDVYYTRESMEITEDETSKRIVEYDVRIADIESNNGGRGFARAVKRKLKEEYKTNKCSVRWFHQSKNKKARILTNSTWVMEHVYFPTNWRDKWPEYYKAMFEYQREGKNAHDDACLVEGTMVATLTGRKPIESIKKGERVFTPYGIRKVLWSGCTGEKEVITNIGLTGTANHKIFNKKSGFINLDTFTGIAENDIISLGGLMKWKYKRLLYSMERNTNLWGRESIILASQVQMKEEKILKDCMLRFGNIITEKKFLKVFMFTIKMVILLITTLATWSVYQVGNMLRNTLTRMTPSSKNFKRQDKKQLKSGIEVKKEGNGIQNMERMLLQALNQSKSLAKSVEKYSKAKEHLQNIVQINVVKDGEVNTEELNIQANVLCVEMNLKGQNTNHLHLKEKHVQNFVQIDSTIKTEKKKVYNLTVDKDHVYYANGLLVSNCDATTGVAEKASRSAFSFD